MVEGYLKEREHLRGLLRFVPTWFRRILQFNQHNRDRWVEERAREIPSGSVVLDVGAGPCRYGRAFSHCHYWAMDFAKYAGSEWSYGPIHIVADILHAPLRDSSLDAILCTEVLEHVPHPIESVREFARLLRPGGRVLLTAPLGSGIHQAPYHFYGGFTPYWYLKFLSEAGFEEISVHPNGGFFKHFGQESARTVMMLHSNACPPTTRAFLRVLQALAVIPFVWVVPLICNYLDRYDRDRGFTVGYFVTARKKRD